MTGAEFLARKTALSKALTATSIRAASETLSSDRASRLAQITGGAVTDIPGGFPIVIHDDMLGAIGVASGTDKQDAEVASAGLAAIGAKT